MLEQKIDELTLAVLGLTKAMMDQQANQVPETVPAEDPPVEVVKATKTKTKKVAKKKKAAVVETKRLDIAMDRDFVVNIDVKDKSPTVSIEDITSEARKNVVANTGDDTVAKGIIDSYQEGASLKTLEEEHYVGVYNDLVEANKKGMEA